MNEPSKTKVEFVATYCGGCGHRFYKEFPIPADEAKEQAKRRRCRYCIEDAKEAKR